MKTILCAMLAWGLFGLLVKAVLDNPDTVHRIAGLFS